MTEPEERPAATKTDWLLIGLLLALVLPLRLWLLHNTEVTARDSIGYIRYALQFEQKPWHEVLKENHQHPGYPVLVWLMSLPIRALDGATTPENMELSAQLVSFIASLLLVMPMYFLGRQFFDRRISFWATLLYQFLPISAQHLSDGISEPIYLVWLVGGLLQMVHAIRDRQVWRCELCGLFTGLAYLTRPEGALILPAFGIMLIVMQLRPVWRCSWQRFFECGTTMALSAALVGSSYVYATGRFSNKPTIETMQKEIAEFRISDCGLQISCIGNPQSEIYNPQSRVVLFAATFPPTDQKAVRLQRSVWALIAELNQGFHYVATLPVILGFYWSFRSLRRRPDFLALLAFAVLHSFILIALAMSVSYISDRHVMILVILGMYFAVAGLRNCGLRIADCRFLPSAIRNPQSAIRISARAWFAILLLILTAFCLPKSLQRLHGTREGNRRAGLWLAQHVTLGDVVVDDHSWSVYFSGMVFQESLKPEFLPDHKGTCFVVTTRSRDPLIDERRLHIAKDATIVYTWPENSSEKARVVVYAQPRDPKTHPWQVRQANGVP